MANEGPQQSVKLNIVVSSGAGTGTVSPLWVNSRWLRIKPINETDTYTITAKDADAIIMFVRTGQIGTFAEKLEMSLGILSTIAISGATTDGTYVCKFDIN